MRLKILLSIMDNISSQSIGKRLPYFDVLKLFAIFLVLWGHCIQYFLSSQYSDEPVYRYIYSFHMPLFMMISGYFSASYMRLHFTELITKKSRQLLLPCVSWAIIFTIIATTITNRPFINALTSSLIYGFWFLKSCFICYIIAYCGYNCKLRKPIWIVITLFISQLIPNYQVSLMFPAFLIGLELKNSAKFTRMLHHFYVIPVLLFIVLLCFWDETFWQKPNLQEALTNRDIYSITEFSYKLLYRIVIGIAGSLTFIILFQKTFGQNIKSKLFQICSSWGQYTLGIYILQFFILERFLARYLNFDNLNFFLFNFIVSPLISIIVLIVCVYIIKLIYKSRIGAFLLFGKSLKQ